MFIGKKRIVPLLLILLIIQSCGFHLRGALSISKSISPVFIEPNTSFELFREIQSLLVNNGINTTDDVEAANAQLELVSETKERTVLSVDSNGRAREYRLKYKVVFKFQVNDADAISSDTKPTVKTDEVAISRSLLFDTGTVLAVENESEVLYREMQIDASRLILLKLQAYSLNK